MDRIETHTGPRGVRLILDLSAQRALTVTRALIEYQGEVGSYWCALETGYCGEVELPATVFSWIERQIGLVDDFHCQFMDAS